MYVTACSKINIGLIVGDRRDDGFHEIETYMARTSLADSLDISIKERKTGFDCRIERSGIGYSLDGKEDLIEKAARIFHSIAGEGFSLSVSIEKRIPPRSGLGGGSSDAAEIIRALSSYFDVPYGLSFKAAERTGSDVPFFLSPFDAARVSGRGEVIEEAGGLSGMALRIFLPVSGVDTANAYARLDGIRRERRFLPPLSRLFEEPELFPNDFQLVQDLPQPLASSPGRFFFSLTGSGCAYYALFPEEMHTTFDKMEKYDTFDAYII